MTFGLWISNLKNEFRIVSVESCFTLFGMFRLWLEFFWTLFELWDFVWSCLDFVNGGQSNFRLYLSHFDFVCTFFKNCLVFVWTSDFVWSHLNRVNIKHKFCICEISLGNFNRTFFELVQTSWILNTRFFNVEIGEFWNLLNTFPKFE